jgi:3,4-dihydroxy 2-butanone 4-phosphate synthase / GTP cyclohydrolase II
MFNSSISDLVRVVVSNLGGKRRLRHVATAPLPTDYGPFHIHVYEHPPTGQTHVALVRGDLGDGKSVLARIHSSCLTGDIFHSARCDCGAQLDSAMQRIAAEGQGVLVYLNQEGRGIGLANKIRAYGLQDEGYDTVEANERLGFAADGRDYRLAADMLRDLGVESIRLLSNNPKKQLGIETHGLTVTELLPLEIPASDHSRQYLLTKKLKMGHLLVSV